ncbi:OstA-like protein [Candidatus Sulfotelmatobacter kueseliae]|uniref:OstA-like protein n=1 Tax=Candidatus Sulfotelmatobacter kueseliae TaxID=2042962 RepID=A0A2U3JVB7_9BACT|nr:OstA-like protein [Candidatus Sulfotelmatobacter kueseliae]
MALPIYRLRRLLAATAVLLTVVVAGMYFYARSRARNVLKEVPNKIGYDIKQTASGYQYSKSDGKRTLFTVQATSVKEFKLNGHAELHNVSIVLYGRDSSRFDQIYGDDFAYDAKTGNVTAEGDVQIDLVANPAGLASPDQSTPKELKNPIHLKTRGLVFNKESGNASTNERVEFRTPQATGWAVGVKYAGKSNTLTLSSQIHIEVSGANAAVIEAEHGTITNEPRDIVLDHPHLDRKGGMMLADRAVFYLGADNSVQRVVATGNVTTETRPVRAKGPAEEVSETRSRADQAEFLLAEKQNLLRFAILTGNVHVDQTGPQPIEGDAGRVVVDFAGQNQMQKVHAVDGARLTEKAEGTKKPGLSSPSQDFELTAPVIDFTVAKGHILDRAETSGAAQIVISPAREASSADAASSRAGLVPGAPAQRTVVTAGKFEAKFATDQAATGTRRTHLTTIHGAPDARIVNSAAGQPDRVSTSESVEATFFPQGGIDAITQQGNVAYDDGQTPDKRMQAWASSARYTPADQMLVLTGNPRVMNGAMVTTAKTIRMNRATGDALAEGEVKSTYSDLQEQPDGGLLASASPIHVTAQRMTAHSTPGVALYSGKARLWQDANVIEAPNIEFERDRKFVTAHGTAREPVQTILVQAERVDKPRTDKAETENTASGKSQPRNFGKTAAPGTSPVAITASLLTYADSERRAHYETGVLAKGIDFSASAKTMDVYLLPRSQTSSQTQSHQSLAGTFAGPGQLDRMVALGDVIIHQPKRRAEGQKLVYTAADDKFVLTGGPPSIFDAEQGKITGVSLTFFRRDDRVLVEGEASTPVVTQTRVAR